LKIAHLWFQQSFELKNEQIIYSFIANIKNTGFSKELQLTGTKKKSKKKAEMNHHFSLLYITLD